MLNFLSLLLVVVSCGYVANAKYITEQPTFIKACKSKDTKCLTESMQSFFLRFETGVPGLKNVPTIDPLKLDKVEIAQSQVQAVNISVVLKNVEIKGMSRLITKTATYDEEKGVFSFDIVVPKLRLVSDYSIQGRILLLQLNGHGKMFQAGDNVEAKLNVLSEVREIDGEKFFYLKAARIHYKLGALKTTLENLFNGNKELEESANLLFNENWKELNEAYSPVLEKTVEKLLLASMKTVFLYIPAKYIISDLKSH